MGKSFKEVYTLEQCDTQIGTAHKVNKANDCHLNWASRSMAYPTYMTMEETIELCVEKTRVGIDSSLLPFNRVITSRHADRFREQLDNP